MSNYEDFKKKAKDAFDTLADASVDAYKVAEEKAKVLARKTKLRAGIVNDKATVRRVSVALGTAYYNKYKDDPNAEFAKMCAEIADAHCKIGEKEAELEELSNAPTKSDFVVDKGDASECCDEGVEEPECPPSDDCQDAECCDDKG